jgi:hypothetical protein
MPRSGTTSTVARGYHSHVMANFDLDDEPDSACSLVRHDADAVPAVGETVEIKGVDYVVRSRRWKSGRLGMSVVVFVHATLETAR